jgi:hypothetical protein
MPKVELDDLELAYSPLTQTIFIMSPDRAANKRNAGKAWKTALHKKDVSASFWNCVVQRLTDDDGAAVELRAGGELQYTVTMVDERAATGIEVAAESGSDQREDGTHEKPGASSSEQSPKEQQTPTNPRP